jgi:hypothetical protein
VKDYYRHGNSRPAPAHRPIFASGQNGKATANGRESVLP